jgi:tetratricopeptide (TPR) repeat protein
MPYRSLGNGFVARVSDLWQINDMLREHKTAVVEGVGVVVGTGGIGKTQLAIEYVHRFGVSYPGGVFWIDAEQGISNLIALVMRGADIDIDSMLEERDQLQQLWKKLSQFFQPVLIVLDNFPGNEPLQPWLPPASSIHILITTRRRDLNYSRLPLDFMTAEEGVMLLNSGDRKFGQEAAKLVATLGGLPLALELARNFLNIRTSVSIDGLLQEIKKVGEIKALSIFAKKYADELPTGHIKEVAATFQISWELASSTAQAVLQCMSLLALRPIPRRLLRKILDIHSGNILEDPLDDAISELANNLSLVELDKDNDPWVHRLIAGFVNTTIGENNSSLHDKVVNAVEEEMARVTDEKDSQSYYQLEKILPHAGILAYSEFIEPGQAIDLLNYLRWHNGKWGRYRVAERHGRKALGLSEKAYEPGHQTIATSQSNLALVLKDLGELKEARDLLRKALESAQKSFEPGHPSIALRQSNLALVLLDLGELEEAKDLLHKALESDQKSFEPGHPSIATSQSNLAMVLQDLGELEEAKDLLHKALESAQKSFELGHRSIALRQSNLATVLQDLGELKEARDLLHKALESAQKSFEPGHPTIATSQSNLALVLRDLGELKEARELLRNALESAQKSFESGHPTIAIRQSNLALVLRDLGELKEALELAQKAYKSFLNKFGPGHPHTITAKRNWESTKIT